MGKIQLQQFEIILSGNRKVYHNNNQIKGFCLIVLNGELDLKNVKIKLNGEAVAKWTEIQLTGKRRTQTHCQKIICLAIDYDLLTNVKERVITKGVHRIPFSFQLPNYCPHSFEGTFGHIRYWIAAEISKPIFSINHKTKEDILLITSLKISGTIPISYHKTKKIRCCCLKTGSISYTINIPKSYFHRGDFIPVSYEIRNKTKTSLKIEATLIERHVFRANRRTKVENNEHITVYGPVILRSTESEDVLKVPIPVNTRLSINCPVIDVEYYVSFYINTNDSSILHYFPVIIIDQNIIAIH